MNTSRYITGRENEARLLKRANRAAAVGRLMLGKIQNWEEFLQSDSVDYENLPRRQLKSGKSDISNTIIIEFNK